MNRFSRLRERLLRSALALFAIAFTATAAMAQVPSVQPPPSQLSTFTAAFNVAAPQTGAGDIFCINGSATRLIKVKRVNVSGIKTTAQAPLFNLVTRSAADSGGTPITAPTKVPLDSQQFVGTATATVAAWTVIPTPGATVGNIGSRYISLAATVAGTTTFVWDPPSLYEEPRLRGVAQGMCLNAPAAFTTDGPTLSIEVTWTEN